MKTKKHMKKVTVKQCSNISMVARNEKKFDKVIDEGHVKQWVGIGWVTERKATRRDYARYPEVNRNNE